MTGCRGVRPGTPLVRVSGPNHIADLQGRGQLGLDIKLEQLAVHRTHDHPGRIQTVVAERRDKRLRVPVTEWGVVGSHAGPSTRAIRRRRARERHVRRRRRCRRSRRGGRRMACVSAWGMTSAAVAPGSGQTATENTGPGVAGVARGARAAAARGPDAGQRALLAGPSVRRENCPRTVFRPGSLLKPDLQWLAVRVVWQGIGYARGDVFLNVSWVSGSDFGCCGRTDSRRNPSAASCLPTVRSCIVTPKRSSIRR